MIQKRAHNRAICEGDKRTIEAPGLYEIAQKLHAKTTRQLEWFATKASSPDWRRVARLLLDRKGAAKSSPHTPPPTADDSPPPWA